ncbi:hypothetical protein [Gracilibacillus halophilus]|nr:hypothetical protein [Gracilibacillus halophilus]
MRQTEALQVAVCIENGFMSQIARSVVAVCMINEFLRQTDDWKAMVCIKN